MLLVFQRYEIQYQGIGGEVDISKKKYKKRDSEKVNAVGKTRNKKMT